MVRRRSIGLILTIIAQALQIPSFLIFGIEYHFVSGLSLFITNHYTPAIKLGISLGFLNKISVAILDNSKEMFFNINVLPIVIIIYLLNMRKKEDR